MSREGEAIAFQVEETMRYHLAYTLVFCIHAHLLKGGHFRTKLGRCLTTLDSVIRAILSDEIDPEKGVFADGVLSVSDVQR